MYNDKSRIERAKEFAKIWWQSRYDSKKSQEFMALSIGVSKKTIQNWEKGLSSPNLFQATEWFNALGLNPLKYYLEFLYPNFSKKINSENEKELDEILIDLIKTMSIIEKKELIYIISGSHGSPWAVLLQLFYTYCQTSLQSRALLSKLLLKIYEIEEQIGKLTNKNKIKPDFEFLKSAILKCKNAAKNGDKGYSVTFLSKEEKFRHKKS